jgi:ADP-ribosylglycohydrolase
MDMEFETYAHSHIIGALYGQALGDAWAMPAYFRPEQTWEHFNGWIDKLLPAPANHPLHAGLQAGQVTDDTQLALALAQTIMTDGQITAEGSARAMVGWYDQIDGDTSSLVDPGIRRVVTTLKSDTDPGVIGLDCDTNAGAMGISPIGLIHAGNPNAAIQDAMIACPPTHFTNVAVSGACAVAAAVAQAISPDTTLEDIIDVAIHGAEVGLRRGNPGLGASVARKIDAAVQMAAEGGVSERDRLQNLYDFIGSTLSAADTVPCAFGVLTMTHGNPVETAIFAATLSGKADTVGAIACAIAGAWQTIEAIPLEYIETLQQANPQYNFEEIAEGLYQIALQNYQAIPQSDEDTLTSSFLDEHTN